MNLVQSIIDLIKPDDVPTYAGSVSIQNYPVVLVEGLDEATVTETLDGSPVITEFHFQVTVASLSPAESEVIGAEINAKLKSSARLIWDEGEPGREIFRRRTDKRERYQTESAPGGSTIYYYELDWLIQIQRD